MSKLPLDMHNASLTPCCWPTTCRSAYPCERLPRFLGFGPYALIVQTWHLYGTAHQSLYLDVVLPFIFHIDVTGI